MQQLRITSTITPRSSLAIVKYMTEINKIPVLTPEREAALGQRIKDGCDEALSELIRSNLRFVISIAKQYHNCGISLCDLVNEGNVGLMKAARKFDASKGFKFITYAVWWIRQSINQAILENRDTIKVPVFRMHSYKKVMAAYVEIVQQEERIPDHREIAAKCDLPVDMVADILESRYRTSSIYTPVGSEDDSSTMLDIIPNHDEMPDNPIVDESMKTTLIEGLESLSPRAYKIIALTFGLDGHYKMTTTEIAHQLDISRERVRQIKLKAFKKLKKKKEIKLLYAQLGEIA